VTFVQRKQAGHCNLSFLPVSSSLWLYSIFSFSQAASQFPSTPKDADNLSQSNNTVYCNLHLAVDCKKKFACHFQRPAVHWQNCCVVDDEGLSQRYCCSTEKCYAVDVKTRKSPFAFHGLNWRRGGRMSRFSIVKVNIRTTWSMSCSIQTLRR
jgi:hypothetical protein